MAAPQDVHVRICNQEIVKFDLEVKALIQDIRDCSGPLSALTELNTKVKEKFQQLRHRIQELEQSAKEQDKESEKQVLLQEVENHKKQMLSNQTSWRKANLTCKIAIDNLEKAELLQGGDLLRQRKTTKESLAQTSSAITESLMGISRMMSQQVQQSEEAMQTLGRKAFPGAFSFFPFGVLTHPSSEIVNFFLLENGFTEEGELLGIIFISIFQLCCSCYLGSC
nr:vesicle transport protein SEC20 isoform X2 [Vulpes vulpes]